MAINLCTYTLFHLRQVYTEAVLDGLLFQYCLHVIMETPSIHNSSNNEVFLVSQFYAVPRLKCTVRNADL